MSDLTKITCDEDFRALCGRWAQRGQFDTEIPEYQTAQQRSAGLWRIERYIPPRFREATLENYQPQTRSQEVAHSAVERWVAAVLAGNSPMLVLIGSTGVGKSHLLYGATRLLNERDVNAGAWAWYDLANTLRDAKSPAGDPEVKANAVYERQRLQRVRSMALDEIRPTAGTDFDPQELSQLLIRAYDHNQAVIATTQWAGDELQQLISVAGEGRFTQLTLDGPNYRRRNLRVE